MEFGTPFTRPLLGANGPTSKHSGRHGLPVVQVVQHRRMPRRGQQQILEMPQHVRADGVALIAPDQQMTQIWRSVARSCLRSTLKWLNQKSTSTSSSCRLEYIARKTLASFKSSLATRRGVRWNCPSRRSSGRSARLCGGSRRPPTGRLSGSRYANSAVSCSLLPDLASVHLVGIQKVVQLRVAPAVLLLHFLLLHLPGIFALPS